MLYSKSIVIPANTSSNSPERVQFKVSRGMVYRVWVTFPYGCAGLARVRVFHEGHPFVPIHKDAYLRGDGFTFEFPMFYEITDEPQQITIEGFNLDDTYEHSVDILILILPKKYIIPGGAEGIMEALKSLVLRPLIIHQEKPEEEEEE